MSKLVILSLARFDMLSKNLNHTKQGRDVSIAPNRVRLNVTVYIVILSLAHFDMLSKNLNNINKGRDTSKAVQGSLFQYDTI